MKKYFLSNKIKQCLFLVCFLSIYCFVSAQKLTNIAMNWPPYSPNGVLRTTGDSTAEDWWFDIRAVDSTHPAYANGKYILCGYSSFDDRGIGNYYTNDPCFSLQEPTFPATDFDSCEDFELPDMIHLNEVCGTVGLMTITDSSTKLNPNAWIYNYGLGSYFKRVIPTSDSGFLVIGKAELLKTPGPLPPPGKSFSEQQFSLYANHSIVYQSPPIVSGVPDQIAFDFGSTCSIPSDTGVNFEYYDKNNPSPRHNHAVLMKLNKDGKVLWMYKYGIVPADSAQAYFSSSVGFDVIEDSAGYLMTGALEDYTGNHNYGGQAFLAQVNKSGILQWINEYKDPDTTYRTNRFTRVVTKKIGGSNYAYVTGERTKYRDNTYISSPRGSWYWNGYNEVFYNSEGTMKFEPFIKKINLGTGAVVWTKNLSIDTNLNHRAKSLVITKSGMLLAAVASGCTFLFEGGECTSSWVYKINDNGDTSTIVNFGPLRAYDLDIGTALVPTDDYGFGVVGTKKTHSIPLDQNYRASPFGNGYNLSACEPSQLGNDENDQTDAFVAKCDSSGNIQWTTIFDNTSNSPDPSNPSTVSILGNPLNPTNINSWMNHRADRSKQDIKRQECLYAIAGTKDGKFVIAGNMSRNIDDGYVALIQNTCELDLNDHLIQAIPTFVVGGGTITNMNNFVATTITTGRLTGNLNDIAQFVVEKNADIKMKAGQVIDMYEGTDLNMNVSDVSDVNTKVDMYIDGTITCTPGPVYQYYFPKSLQARPELELTALDTTKAFVDNGMTVYPNPNTGHFTVKFTLTNESTVSVNLIDVTGAQNKLLLPSTNLNAGTNLKSFDISQVSAGIYFCNIIINGKSTQFKIIKQ